MSKADWQWEKVGASASGPPGASWQTSSHPASYTPITPLSYRLSVFEFHFFLQFTFLLYLGFSSTFYDEALLYKTIRNLNIKTPQKSDSVELVKKIQNKSS